MSSIIRKSFIMRRGARDVYEGGAGGPWRRGPPLEASWDLFFGASDFCTFKTMDLAVFLDDFFSLHLFARGKSLQILHLDLVLRFS